jgi:hypothetical protein
MRPKRETAASTTFAIAARLRASASKPNAEPPFARRVAAISLTGTPSRSTRNTWAPFSANSWATPAPIPAAAPVTTTTLSLIGSISLPALTLLDTGLILSNSLRANTNGSKSLRLFPPPYLEPEARQIALLQFVVDHKANANRQRNQADRGARQHFVLIHNPGQQEKKENQPDAA